MPQSSRLIFLKIIIIMIFYCLFAYPLFVSSSLVCSPRSASCTPFPISPSATSPPWRCSTGSSSGWPKTTPSGDSWPCGILLPLLPLLASHFFFLFISFPFSLFTTRTKMNSVAPPPKALEEGAGQGEGEDQQEAAPRVAGVLHRAPAHRRQLAERDLRAAHPRRPRQPALLPPVRRGQDRLRFRGRDHERSVTD
jgi:hypothetical protein